MLVVDVAVCGSLMGRQVISMMNAGEGGDFAVVQTALGEFEMLPAGGFVYYYKTRDYAEVKRLENEEMM